ncbi:MAG: hypothetical protein HOW73_47700 [Polyangiaceae bacterium]|nr:hypothetical protein [Polyangiaceae bacterium]
MTGLVKSKAHGFVYRIVESELRDGQCWELLASHRFGLSNSQWMPRSERERNYEPLSEDEERAIGREALSSATSRATTDLRRRVWM